MRRHGRADLGAASVHQVEDTGREACVVYQLGKKKGAQGDSSLGFNTTVQPAAIAGATFAVI